MSSLEEQVKELTKRLATLEKRVDRVDGGAGGGRSSRPASAASRKPKKSSGPPSTASSNGVKKSSSKTSVKSRGPAASRRSSSDFKAESLPDELQGSYYVGKRKVPYQLPDSFLGKSPSDAPPRGALELEYVHGYNGRSCRDNIHVLADDKDGTFVYCIAATGVVHNPKTREQRYFKGHNEDIVSFAAHPTKKIIATGQTDPKGAEKPYVCVWSYDGAEPKEVGRLAEFHDRGICAIAFSGDGSQIVTVGMDDSRTVAVWDTPSGGKTLKRPKLNAIGAKADIHTVACAAGPELAFVTAGAGQMKSWAVNSDGILKGTTVSVMGKSVKQPEKAFLSARYLPDGRAVVGGKSGRVYVVNAAGKLEKALPGHAANVGAVAVSADGSAFFTAGSEKVITWSADKLEKTGEAELKATPVAMDVDDDGNLTVGTSQNSVFEVGKGGKTSKIIDGHSGEIWGLAVHPSQEVFATGAHDRHVRVWDCKTKKTVSSFSIPPGKNKKEKDAVRSLAFSPAGDMLAIGCRSGTLMIMQYPGWEEVYSKKVCKEQIDALNFSPNGQLLAAGSWDQTTVMLDVASKRLSPPLKGHTSSVTHLTFSVDSKYIATNSRDYEILYWDSETGKRVKVGAVREVEWYDWQNILGWPVRGIFGAGFDGTDVNAVNVSKDKEVIAIGDDFGMVHLFKYPALHEHPKDVAFEGHSSHVTNVRFTHDDTYLISCGGLDYGVFQWRYTK